MNIHVKPPKVKNEVKKIEKQQTLLELYRDIYARNSQRKDKRTVEEIDRDVREFRGL